MLNNKRGVSLIEVLFSLVIISLVGVALLKTSALSMRANFRDAVRTEGINVASGRMDELRNLLFSEGTASIDGRLTATGGLVPDPPNAVSRNIGNTPVNFNVNKNIVDITAPGVGVGAKQITVTVDWLYSGQSFSFSSTSILKRSR